MDDVRTITEMVRELSGAPDATLPMLATDVEAGRIAEFLNRLDEHKAPGIAAAVEMRLRGTTW